MESSLKHSHNFCLVLNSFWPVLLDEWPDDLLELSQAKLLILGGFGVESIKKCLHFFFGWTGFVSLDELTNLQEAYDWVCHCKRWRR